MRMRLLVLAGFVVFLLAAGPAAAATKTATSTSGQTTATLTYDYKRTSFGASDYSNLHVTIDRAGARLVDQDVAGQPVWPANGAQKGLSSVTVRDLDGDGEPEVLLDLY